MWGQARHENVFDLEGMVYPDALQWIEKDTAGFVWLATDRGVMRTDGFRHKWVLQAEAKPITALLVGRSGVYVGYEDGSIATIDGITHQVIARSGSIGSAVSCMYEWSDKRIFFGTRDKGLGWTDRQNTQMMSALDSTLDLSVHCLGKWGNRMMVATDMGLYSVDFSSQAVAQRFDPDRQILEDHYINAMQETEEGLFLAGENGSLCRLNADGSLTSATYFNAFHAAPIVHLALHDDAIWLIDRDYHVYSLQRTDLERIFASSEYEDNVIQSDVLDICVNQHGTMMLTTGFSEVVMIDLIQHSLVQHDAIDLSQIDALTMTNDRYIWLANSEGLYRHHADFIEGQVMNRVMQLQGERIVALCALDSSTMVAGTFGHGLYVLNVVSGAVRIIDERSGLLNNHITSMALQGHSLWLSTLGGLACVDTKTWKERARFDAESPLGASYLYGVHPMADGSLYIGTDGKGLICMKEGEFTSYRETHPELGRSIIQMVSDQAQRLWMVTLDHGIQCWYNGSLQSHPKLVASQLGEIGSIQIYRGHDLLVFCSKGVFLYNPTSGVLQLVKEMRNALSEGFQNMLIDPLANRLWLARKGDLWSCDLDEFVHLHVPHIFVDGVLQSLQPVPFGQREFGPDENYLTFLLSVPWFDHNEFPSIRYRLLGLDSNWITTQERIIHFPKLAPGDYELELQVVLHGEVMPGPSARYAFRIRQPFYRRPWFIALMMLVVAIGVIFFLRIRDRRLTRRAFVRQKQLESELQLLRSQINPHFLFNSFNTLSYTIEKNQDEAVEYVEKLSDYFRLVLQRTGEPLITVGEELNLVSHYIYLQKKRFGSLLDITTDVPEGFRSRMIPPMVIQMLLENAVKHNSISRDHLLHVRISIENGCIVVANNINPLIKKQTGTGTGLRNIQRRVEILMQRELLISDDGANFVVKIPLEMHPQIIR